MTALDSHFTSNASSSLHAYFDTGAATYETRAGGATRAIAEAIVPYLEPLLNGEFTPAPKPSVRSFLGTPPLHVPQETTHPTTPPIKSLTPAPTPDHIDSPALILILPRRPHPRQRLRARNNLRRHPRRTPGRTCLLHGQRTRNDRPRQLLHRFAHGLGRARRGSGHG